ncbi:MAG: hypothetical protein NTX11_03165 [Candidatus Saccharibacteria bacterium]|nr:hypothetical protein [Candidatus Saccharibacteria bacterium]
MLSEELKERLAKKATTEFISTTEKGEHLVAIGSSLQQNPFWLDKSELVHEIEGKFYDSYIKEHADFKLLVRESVLERLQAAQAKLPKHWHIVVRAGYRPLEVQTAMFDDYVDKLEAENPDWSMDQCIGHAEQYISNPYHIVACPHVTGGAIDIEIYDSENGVTVDMGGKICELGVKSHILNDKLNKVQRQNQETLIEAMFDVGFAPFSTEWWHFSYGDHNWARFYEKKCALYGSAYMSI